MKKTGRNLLACLLAVMIAVTFIPCIAFAADGEDPQTGETELSKDLADAVITGVSDIYYGANPGAVWHGQEMGKVTVMMNGEVLVYEEDFNVSYENNEGITTPESPAVIKFTAIEGSGYTGFTKREYQIEKQIQRVEASVSKTKICVGQNNAMLYVPFGGDSQGFNIGTLSVKAANDKIRIIDKGESSKDHAYEIVPEKKGTGKVKVSFSGNEYYYDSAKTFAVTVVAKKEIKAKHVKLSTTSYTYSGKAKKPAVTVKVGSKKLKKNTDYTVKYSNNIEPGTARVTVKGKGNYCGTVEKTYKINKAAQKISVKTSATTLKEKGTTATIKQTPAQGNVNIGVFTYSSSNPNVVKVKRDQYHNCTVTSVGKGTATVTITAGATNHYKKATKKVKFTVTSAVVVKPLDSSMIVITPKTFKYDGKEHYPDVTAYTNAAKKTGKLTYGTDWRYYIPDGKSKGKQEIQIWGVGSYASKKFSMYYTIQ